MPEPVALAVVLDHVRVVDRDVGRPPLEVVLGRIAAVVHHLLDEPVGLADRALRGRRRTAPARAPTRPRSARRAASGSGWMSSSSCRCSRSRSSRSASRRSSGGLHRPVVLGAEPILQVRRPPLPAAAHAISASTTSAATASTIHQMRPFSSPPRSLPRRTATRPPRVRTTLRRAKRMPAAIRAPADDLNQRHPLGKEDEREHGRHERLQVGDERGAREGPIRCSERNQSTFVSTSGPSVAKTSSAHTSQPRP